MSQPQSKFKTSAGTELPLLNLRGKPYLQVAHRIVWFREDHPNWSIETTVTPDFENRRCVAKATIINEEGEAIATAHKVEDSAGFNDYVEKSETGAIGRALALCGYGTQFAPEFDEGERLADSPAQPARQPIKPSQPSLLPPQATQPASDRRTHVKRLAEANGWKLEQVAELVKSHGVSNVDALSAPQYQELTAELASGPWTAPPDDLVRG